MNSWPRRLLLTPNRISTLSSFDLGRFTSPGCKLPATNELGEGCENEAATASEGGTSGASCCRCQSWKPPWNQLERFISETGYGSELQPSRCSRRMMSP